MIQIEIEYFSRYRLHKHRILDLQILQCHSHRRPVKGRRRSIVGEIISNSHCPVSILEAPEFYLAGCICSKLHIKRSNIVWKKVHKISYRIEGRLLVFYLEVKTCAKQTE